MNINIIVQLWACSQWQQISVYDSPKHFFGGQSSSIIELLFGFNWLGSVTIDFIGNLDKLTYHSIRGRK